jgi:hypothetical protein
MANMVFEVAMGISGLSDSEYKNMVGHYNRLVYGTNIDQSIYDRGYSDAAIKEMEKRATPQTVESLNLRFTSALDNFELEGFDYYYSLYQYFSTNKALPFSGSLADQPAKIIEIFSLFNQLEQERELKLHKEAQRNGRHQRQSRSKKK